MSWAIVSDDPGCSGYAVIDESGELESCHADEASARLHLVELEAAATTAEVEAPLDEWTSATPVTTTTAGGHILAFNVLTNPASAARAAKTGREERRGSLEIREDPAANTAEIFGHASVFDEPYTITDSFGEYEEVVRPGAFAKSIREQDVRLYVNHEGLAIARSSAPGPTGKLELREDPVGLAYRAPVDTAITVVGDLVKLMRAGIMRDSSFAFQPVAQSWSADYSRRELLEVKLFDVSVVSLPANPAATAGVRQAELVRWLADADPLELAGELRAAQILEPQILEVIRRLAIATAGVREGAHLEGADLELASRAIDAIATLIEAPAGERDARPMMVAEAQAMTELLRRRR